MNNRPNGRVTLINKCSIFCDYTEITIGDIVTALSVYQDGLVEQRKIEDHGCTWLIPARDAYALPCRESRAKRKSRYTLIRLYWSRQASFQIFLVCPCYYLGLKPLKDPRKDIKDFYIAFLGQNGTQTLP